MAARELNLADLVAFPMRAEAALRDFTKPLRQCQQLVVSAVQAGFQSSTDPDGRPWKPLAHPRPRGAGKPLYDTGRLLASIRSTVTSTTLEVGTNLIYAGLHQYGGTVVPKKAKLLAIPLSSEASRYDSPRQMDGLHRQGRAMMDRKGNAHWALVASVKVPARPFLGFGKQVQDDIVTVFQRFLGDAVAGALG